MNIGLSDITRSFRSHSGVSGKTIQHGHAQQLLVAAFGYKTLASCQAAKASDEEPENFNQVRHIVLDRASLTQRATELGVECDIDQLSHFLANAFADRLAGVVLHHSYSDLDDYIRVQITQLVENNGRVIGEMAQLNHDGLGEVYFDLQIDLDQIQVGESLSSHITGYVSLNLDTERPYTGTTIDFRLSLTVERLGKRCYSAFEYVITNVVARTPWDYDDDDYGEPPVRTRAEVIAELLGWSVDEVDNLQDVDEMPLDGSSGEMIYGYLIDFTDYASPEVATRIMREHGTLQFNVGPDFFDGVRYDGWPH
ncbi:MULTISPECIES: hypothetical protein [Stenotrophomonas]|uniref:hypothetical protein n=1 Tax=Stenotrophomonas TaxID=40323 RepID=UPI0007703116|nr:MULTISPECIES: hypothetical protein [Stenotrophomonas]AMJ56219.1 hypothetical protein AXG53_05820 [Stenotrophomonas sp. KCTC 12332]